MNSLPLKVEDKGFVISIILFYPVASCSARNLITTHCKYIEIALTMQVTEGNS